jgi:23S rRNA (uracil1939-C5)-methyltransferase
MKKGQEIELRIEKFADRGKTVSRIDGYVVFVAGAVPGDVVRVRIFKQKKNYAEARLIQVLEPGPLRTDPVCKYFGICGGCKWQHVQYEAQLEAKRQSVVEALTHHAGFESVEVLPTLGADPIYRYRNKMEFSFGAKRWLTQAEIDSGASLDTRFAVGLHIPGRYDKVLDLDTCYLLPEIGVRILNRIRDFAKEQDWSAWHVHKQQGFLRHLVLRMSVHTTDLMVNLVTHTFEPDRMAILTDYLRSTFPEVSTFVNTINSGVAQTAFGETSHTLYGPGVVHDCIGPYRFEIAPGAFFQTNTRQAEKLYEVARDFAELKPDDLLYDLYCGAGTISLFVASQVRRVIGVELIEAAVQNARTNATANQVSNCTFLSGDLMRMFTPEFVRKQGQPDVLIVDPPRAGMHPRVVEQIARLHPERFVYVSCNPLTQARDLSMLKDVYTIEAVQPVDLFPHTHHIENVIKLRRRL